MANDQLYQGPVEVVVSPTDGDARTYQEPVEVVVLPTDADAQTYQLAIEVVVQNLTIIDLGLIDQTASTFTPTLTGGGLGADFGLIDQTASAFSPAVTAGTVSIELGLIDQTAVLSDPSISTGASGITLGLIDQTAAAFDPTVGSLQAVSLALIDQTSTAHAPTVAVGVLTVSLGLVDQTAAMFTPSVATTGTQVVVLPQIAQTAVIHSPVVGLTVLHLWRVSKTVEVFAPLLLYNQSAALGLIDQTAVVHSPMVALDHEVILGLIDQAAVAYAPAVATPVSVDRIDQTAAAHVVVLSFTQGVTVGLISQSASTFEPDVTRPNDVALNLINQTAVMYAPTVYRSSGINIFNTFTGIRTGTENPFTFNAIGWINPTGVVLSVAANDSGNQIAGVTYGGQPMTEIVTADRVIGETGFTSLWFLKNPPSGTQPFVITLTSATTTDFFFVGMALTSSFGLEVVDFDSLSGDLANPSVILSDPSGRPGISFATLFSGHDGSTSHAVLAGWGTMANHDYGTETVRVARQNARSTGDHPAGFTATIEDTALVALRVAETVNQIVSVGRINRVALIHAPTLVYARNVFPDLITQTAVAHAPSVAFSQSVSLGIVDQTSVAFAPSIVSADVVLPLITQTATMFTPSVAAGAAIIDLGLINQPAVARPPIVSIVTAPPGGGGGGGGGGAGGGGPNTNQTRVFIAGLGDVSPVLVYAECELETAVGGEASVGYITVRDIGQQRADFVPMSRILIDRGPGTDPIYQGYLIKPSRRFWFDADYPETLQRKWVLWVADINLLWTRRVTFNKSDPADIEGPKYTSNTYDDVALAELFENWVDLSTDDIDTTTRVSRVGLINYDQTTYPWNGGQTMLDAVRTIAQLPAAVYGIDSSRRVVYADVDDENAPFVLSDAYIPGWTPVGTPGADYVGYRESTIIHDGTRLANDVMAWGFGMGSPLGVFRRLRDSDSIDNHGLWQESVTLYSVYRQATINKVADSVVNGSPGSRRGRKNDKDSVELVIHRDGLHVGDRIRFISHIWQYEDVIPVRKMKIKFPTPFDVRYELLLSHEIDEWGFQDPLPPFPIPGPFPFPFPDIPWIVEPPPLLPPSCVESEQMVDNFGRSVGPIVGPFTDGETSMWGTVPSSFTDGVRRWTNWGLTSTFGNSSSAARVIGSAGEAYLKVASTEFGVRQPYYAAAAWNKDVVTVTFGFGFYSDVLGGTIASIPVGTEVELTVGAVKAVFRPTDNEIDVVTASGTTTAAFTDWEHETWYLAELSLDLVNNSVRVKLERETDPNEFFSVTRDANGERVGVGDYLPEIGIWVRSLSTTSTVWFGRVLTKTYADAAAVENDFVQGWASPPWIGTLDGIELQADGSVLVSNALLIDSNQTITRDIPDGIGSIDIAFSVSDYVALANMFRIFFDASQFNYLQVGTNMGARVGDGSGTSGTLLGFSTGLFNGNPVNIRCQWSPTFVRVKVWAGGTAEPSDWGPSTAYYTMETGPALLLGFRPLIFFASHQFRIGPLQLDTGEAPARINFGPTDIAQTLRSDQGGTITDRGRSKSWPFTDPSGGYAVPFGTDQYNLSTFGLVNATPHYQVGVVWPVFGPAKGNGIPYQRFHRISSISFPVVLHDGVPIDYVIRVRGTVRANLGAATRDDLGATGIMDPFNVVIESFNYGLDAAVVPPPVIDYNIEQGLDEWNSIFENVQVGASETKSFDLIISNLVHQSDGSKVLQMSVYAHGIDRELAESVERSGPLWGGAFLVTGNFGNLGIHFTSATFEIVPTSIGYPINPRVDPCLPDPTGYDYTQENGRICTTWFGNEIDGVVDDFPMPGKYVPDSVDVIVNGETLTPGVDFTETVDNTEVHLTTPPPAGAWVFICCTVI
jgi:hypothetical protein